VPGIPDCLVSVAVRVGRLGPPGHQKRHEKEAGLVILGIQMRPMFV
jgi:hypothetical protein